MRNVECAISRYAVFACVLVICLNLGEGFCHCCLLLCMLSKLRMLFIWFSPLLIRGGGLTLERSYYAPAFEYLTARLWHSSRRSALTLIFRRFASLNRIWNVSSGIINDVDGGNLVFFSIILVSPSGLFVGCRISLFSFPLIVKFDPLT